MANLDDYHPNVVQKAFWVQQQIYEDGLEPVHFMRAAYRWAERNAEDEVSDAIGRRL